MGGITDGMMKFPASVWVVLVLWVGMARAAEMPGLDDKWKRYESPNFELFSHVSDGQSRELLRTLELLRATFAELIEAKEQRPNPLTIYYFKNEREFLPYVSAPLRSAERTAGYYLERPDRSVIVLSPAWTSEDARRLIMHEFVHYLMSVTGDRPGPWYGEGVAEFLSTIDERKDHLIMGQPIVEHVAALRGKALMPMQELFAVSHGSPSYNESRRIGLFYAQSWALVHYWYCGRSKRATGNEKGRNEFFHYARNPEGDPRDPVALFEESLGMDYGQMQRELSRYVETGRYAMFKLPMPQIAAANSYAMRAVARPEMALHLASLDLRVNRAATSKLALLEELTRNPGDTRALEILGTEAWADGAEHEARERWMQAIAAGTENHAIYHEVAAMEARRWFDRLDPYFRLPNERATELRTLLQRSIERVPGQAQAYEILAWVEATAEKPSPKNINVVQANLAKVKERPRTLLALALVRARVKDLATARVIVEQMEKEGVPPKMRMDVERLTEYIARMERAGG